MTEAIQKPNPVGRPTVKTEEVLRKIEEVAALDGSVEEMAYYAGIHFSTLYQWLKDDQEFSERIEALRQKPVLKARNTVVAALNDPNHAFRYLERKRSKEFMPAAKIEHAGTVAFTPGAIGPEQEAIKAKYEDELRASLAGPAEPRALPQPPAAEPEAKPIIPEAETPPAKTV